MKLVNPVNSVSFFYYFNLLRVELDSILIVFFIDKFIEYSLLNYLSGLLFYRYIR